MKLTMEEKIQTHDFKTATVADVITFGLVVLMGVAGIWFFDFAEAQDNTAPTSPRIIVTPDSFLFVAGRESLVVVSSHDADGDKIVYTIDFGDGGDAWESS